MKTQNELDINGKLEYAENYLMTLDSYSEDEMNEIKRKFASVKSEIKRRWKSVRSRIDLFEKNNENWLNGVFELPKKHSKAGRPQKLFEEASERSKRRKTEQLRQSDSPNKIIYAAQMELRAQGQRHASNILKEISENRDRANLYVKAVECPKATQAHISPEDALKMFVKANLTMAQYEIIRNTTGNLPCYSILQQHKKTCYPAKESFHVTEDSAEVKLQAVIDHTAERLLKHLGEVLNTLKDDDCNTLQMICKWGCDGSQQAQYKQKFENDSACDSHIFISSFVPLRITYGSNKILWQNPTPSSSNYCRPIRVRFVKETVDVTNEEIQYIENAESKLKPTSVTFGSRSYKVKCNMLLTMIDGKVCNAATGTKSTLRCYICGATSKEFNDISVRRPVHKETLKFGLSILHARIRLFETLLHIAYKLPVQNLPAKSESDKLLIKQNKERIQEEFKQKLGLRVDFPKAGFGNTNDGNTSRRFFTNHELAAEITGIDVTLIKRFKIILECISSGYKIHKDRFEKFTKETAELYVQLYNRHPMTPTLHKILIHGPEVVENALLPIGQLSEEAAEARNKHFRQYRQNFARKFSRIDCNTDVIQRLLLTSDPFIAAGSKTLYKNKKAFMPETLEMLVCEENEEECENYDELM